MLGEHCLKTWSTNQSSPALSSCEAEYYAVVDGASRAFGIADGSEGTRHFGRGLVCGDGDRLQWCKILLRRGVVQAASVTSRSNGSGCSRRVADGRFRMTKVVGSLNPADILTKYKGLRDFEEQLKRVNVHVMVRGSDQGGGGGGESAIGGRASGGPRVVSWADALEEEQETRDIKDAGMQHVDGSGRMIAAAEEECWKSSADQRPAGRKTRDGPMMLSAFLA